MARYLRHTPSEFSAARIAAYVAASIFAGLLIAAAVHYVGRLKLDFAPTKEKLVKIKLPSRDGPTEAELLDAQQPLDPQQAADVMKEPVASEMNTSL